MAKLGYEQNLSELTELEAEYLTFVGAVFSKLEVEEIKNGGHGGKN